MRRHSRNAVLVVGLGPAGTIVAHRLAAAGVPVLAVQPSSRGRHPLVSPPPTVRRSPSHTAAPAATPPAGTDRPGGAKHLAAPQSYRLHDHTFAHGWPITAEELAPYWRRIERLHRVEARPATAWTARMARAAERLGHPNLPAPAAASTDVTGLHAHPLITVIDGAATRILRSGDTATGVIVHTADGAVRHLHADATVLAGGVVATVRLLLHSQIDAHGRVGRGFSSHAALAVHGHFAGIDLARDTAGAASAVAVTAFESPTGLGFTGGSILQAAMTGPRGAAWRDAVAAGDRAPDTAWIDAHAASIGTVWAQPEQLPHPDNRIDLDPTAVDALGDRVARITYDLHDDDRLRGAWLDEAMREWLRAAGARERWSAPVRPQPLGTHLYGGAVMGDDAATSVVDRWGRTHDVAQLWIVGSSTFASAGTRGPVQTIEALALRTAEALLVERGAAG